MTWKNVNEPMPIGTRVTVMAKASCGKYAFIPYPRQADYREFATKKAAINAAQRYPVAINVYSPSGRIVHRTHGAR